MARRKRIYISREQKEEIIKELIKTNCNIKLLAEKYQVTARTLSRWRSDYYKAEEGKQPKPEGHFVEVQVGSDIKKSHLKKVELFLDKTGNLPVPLHLRNAPTKFMKDLSYGKNYQYSHKGEQNFIEQEYLPDAIKNTTLYQPQKNSREQEIRKFLQVKIKHLEKKEI